MKFNRTIYKLTILLKIILILFSFTIFIYPQNFLIITSNFSNKDNILIYQKNERIYSIEFFYSTENEKKISFYYINEYIIPLLVKSKYTRIEYTNDLKLPIISFENLTPIKIEYNIIKELDFKIIDYGDLNKNFQLLIVFSKEFGNDFMLRLVEFKVFNKDYKTPIFISGGVHIKIENDIIEIVNEF